MIYFNNNNKAIIYIFSGQRYLIDNDAYRR